MKAYQLKTPLKVWGQEFTTGRIVCETGNQTLVIATPTQPHVFISNSYLSKLRSDEQVEEIVLEEIKWIHPHLYKPIKTQLHG